MDTPLPSYDFDTLYQEYHRKILLYLSGVVGTNEAEDLTQDVFNKVTKSLKHFKGDSSISTWLYRIATNTATDRFRSASFQQQAAQSSFDENIVSNRQAWLPMHIAPTVDQTMVKQEMQQCIREFVGKLPMNYRAVIMLSELEEFSNKEIADILDISISNVKIRLHRGRTMLKEILNNGCDFYYSEDNELACNRKQS